MDIFVQHTCVAVGRHEVKCSRTTAELAAVDHNRFSIAACRQQLAFYVSIDRNVSRIRLRLRPAVVSFTDTFCLPRSLVAYSHTSHTGMFGDFDLMPQQFLPNYTHLKRYVAGIFKRRQYSLSIGDVLAVVVID